MGWAEGVGGSNIKANARTSLYNSYRYWMLVQNNEGREKSVNHGLV